MEAIVIRNNLAYRQDGGQDESGERIKEGVGWRNGVVGRRDGRNEKDAGGGRKVWRRTLAIAGNSFWIAGPSSMVLSVAAGVWVHRLTTKLSRARSTLFPAMARSTMTSRLRDGINYRRTPNAAPEPVRQSVRTIDVTWACSVTLTV